MALNKERAYRIRFFPVTTFRHSDTIVPAGNFESPVLMNVSLGEYGQIIKEPGPGQRKTVRK